MDGLFCSIFLDPWTNDGDHHISCLPCGHLFSMSCIKLGTIDSSASAESLPITVSSRPVRPGAPALGSSRLREITLSESQQSTTEQTAAKRKK
ncbi:hypothetical protein ACFX12_037714 [Malus domestica]